MSEFQGFPKIPRLNREILITEKIDGSNAQILIEPRAEWRHGDVGPVAFVGTEAAVWAGSRNRWLTAGGAGDNFGFGQWVKDNAETLVRVLGEGRHFGEWWGKGIQRGYMAQERYFSLFNTTRWAHLTYPDVRSSLGIKSLNLCVVPELYRGDRVVDHPEAGHDVDAADWMLFKLRTRGSYAARGFMDPEGIIVFHTASNQLYKATCKDDENPKSKA